MSEAVFSADYARHLVDLARRRSEWAFNNDFLRERWNDNKPYPPYDWVTCSWEWCWVPRDNFGRRSGHDEHWRDWYRDTRAALLLCMAERGSIGYREPFDRDLHSTWTQAKHALANLIEVDFCDAIEALARLYTLPESGHQ